MADQSAQDHLYQHYGDMRLRIVEEPDSGAGMSQAEAGAFLRSLKPVARVKKTLGGLLKKAS